MDAELLSSKSNVGNLKPGTAIGAVGDADGPAVGGGHLFDDRKSQTTPPFGSRVARVEHRATVSLWDPRAIIFDVEPIIQRPDGNFHVSAGMFHRVPNEILQQLGNSTSIGLDCPIDLDVNRRVCRLNVLPTAFSQVRESDGFCFAYTFAFPGQRQEISNKRIHSVMGPGYGIDVLAFAFFPRQFEPTLGDVQWVPEVMTDDTDELVEPISFTLELPFAFFLGGDIRVNRIGEFTLPTSGPEEKVPWSIGGLSGHLTRTEVTLTDILIDGLNLASFAVGSDEVVQILPTKLRSRKAKDALEGVVDAVNDRIAVLDSALHDTIGRMLEEEFGTR